MMKGKTLIYSIINSYTTSSDTMYVIIINKISTF